jgi:hypothetical protein
MPLQVQSGHNKVSSSVLLTAIIRYASLCRGRRKLACAAQWLGQFVGDALSFRQVCGSSGSISQPFVVVDVRQFMFTLLISEQFELPKELRHLHGCAVRASRAGLSVVEMGRSPVRRCAVC